MNFNRPSVTFNCLKIFFNLNLFLLLLLPLIAEAQNEIEITSFYAKVYVAPSTNANFIGLTQKGERYAVLGIRGSWYNIRFKNANGWVQFSQVTPYNPNVPVATDVQGGSASGDTGSGTQAQTQAGSIVSAPSTTSTGRPALVSDSQPGTKSIQRAPSTQTRSSSSSRPTTRKVSSRSSSTSEKSKRESSVKKESKLRAWFTQQNLPELPAPVLPNEDNSLSIRYFQVQYPSRVLEFLSPDAPILGMAKQGQILALINEGDSWCRVAFADTVGWIESKHGKIIDPASAFSIDYVKIALFAGGVVAVIIVVILLMVFITKRRNKVSEEDDTVKKNMLIIAKASKTIQYTLTNGTTTLEKCFNEVGFSIFYARDIAAIKSYCQQTKPDVVLIDHHFDNSIIDSVELICGPLGFSSAVLFIVYNVPDPVKMHPGKILPNMAFLGLTFSDRDVFKLVTPLLKTANGDTIQKSVQSSALAGNIADGNLLEVLQFIEIGSKTGCLLIEMEKPFAIICFKNGRIIFAATANKVVGRDAIFKVLDLKIGKFRFVLDKKPKESNVNLSTLEILMEWAKAVDEAHEH